MKPEWVDDFVAWHEQRLQELIYPPEICAEFRRSRHQLLASAAKRLKS